MYQSGSCPEKNQNEQCFPKNHYGTVPVKKTMNINLRKIILQKKQSHTKKNSK